MKVSMVKQALTMAHSNCIFNHQTIIHHSDRGKQYCCPDYTEFAGKKGFVNNTCVTLAEALQMAGYTTAMTGKWHVGEAPQYWPQRRGFEHFFGIPQGGGAYFFRFL